MALVIFTGCGGSSSHEWIASEETCPNTSWNMWPDPFWCLFVGGVTAGSFLVPLDWVPEEDLPYRESQQFLEGVSYKCDGSDRFQIFVYSEYAEIWEGGRSDEPRWEKTLDMILVGWIDSNWQGAIEFADGPVAPEDPGTVPASGRILSCGDTLTITDLIVDGVRYPDMKGVDDDSPRWCKTYLLEENPDTGEVDFVWYFYLCSTGPDGD